MDYDRCVSANVGAPVPHLPAGSCPLSETSSPQTVVSIDQPYEGDIDAPWLESVTKAGLTAADITGDVEVSLLITDDETVRRLNAEYRGLDETTDVLSFSTEHPGHWEGEDDEPPLSAEIDQFVLPPGLPTPLGEIIISWPQAQRQARDRGVDPESELALLVVHGALHLVGHDHVEPEETALMQALEQQALRSLAAVESPLS